MEVEQKVEHKVEIKVEQKIVQNTEQTPEDIKKIEGENYESINNSKLIHLRK